MLGQGSGSHGDLDSEQTSKDQQQTQFRATAWDGVRGRRHYRSQMQGAASSHLLARLNYASARYSPREGTDGQAGQSDASTLQNHTVAAAERGQDGKARKASGQPWEVGSSTRRVLELGEVSPARGPD